MDTEITFETWQSVLDKIRQELLDGYDRQENGEPVETLVTFDSASEFERGADKKPQFRVNGNPVWVFWVKVPWDDFDTDDFFDEYLVSVTGTDTLTARIHGEQIPDINGSHEIYSYMSGCASKGRETA